MFLATKDRGRGGNKCSQSRVSASLAQPGRACNLVDLKDDVFGTDLKTGSLLMRHEAQLRQQHI